MRKPTYYLWRNDFSSQEEFEAERRKYADIGFRVSHFWMEIQTLIFMMVLKHWSKITGIMCDLTSIEVRPLVPKGICSGLTSRQT